MCCNLSPLHVNEKLSLSEKKALARSFTVKKVWCGVSMPRALHGLGNVQEGVSVITLTCRKLFTIQYFPVSDFSPGRMGVLQAD